MKSDLGQARVQFIGGVPRAAARPVEPVQTPGQPIREGCVDKGGVREAICQLPMIEMLGTVCLGSQALACRPLDFGEVRKIFLADKFQKHRVAKSRARYQPNGAIRREVSDKRCKLHWGLEAASQSIDMPPHIQHRWDAAFDHYIDGRMIAKQWALVAKTNPTIRHVIGEKQM